MTKPVGAKWVNRTLVECAYSIGLCRSEREFQAELRRRKIPAADWPDWLNEGSDASVHYFESDDSRFAIVCVDGVGESPSDIVGLLVHEAVHIWQIHCECVGEKNPSDEFEAYSIQAISQRLISAYGRVGDMACGKGKKKGKGK